ncbi:hypothetical protein AJ85_18075 [Alkalihalobacillus alcalophilus ATCC 27647 = CGMCC 1.3604]|uniref:WCX domain-containing protein n=1 Tax=Alkalihalobacillus alcalophilus ATCC 27647 = CGMCC 1.3604 TaxID=1218173 RepID=A0A094WIV3_ALKAL|nr:hypothetical protein BALCAV_0219680 [Alkalihalobacillus alcalophilus ATCC 27647 = CGMCC 1.3604]THG89374.1 hypothetical protein AJ85_18075 [Alkalihalobacillus alcalophilus ATCC 27647 = CGMCC 1.3604]
MFTGEEVTVKLRVDSSIEEYVYRAFPTAQKINVYKGKYTIFDVKVLGMDGILFWILGQQDRVKVISPEELRNKVKDIIFRMTKIYK